MKFYTDETFYNEEYLYGRKAVITTSFPYYARDATQKIKKFTGSNVDEDNIPECVKMCCCELMELTFGYEKMLEKSGGKSSESVGGWSASYESSEQSMQVHEEQVKACVYKWLCGTGLLYRGVR